MDFGIVLQTDPPAWRIVDLARQGETLGFDYAYTFDSHLLWQEPFVIYAEMLAATHRMKVGPMVTNPGTRDATVLASLFATLNDMYGNRTVCAIGRGDSAMRVIGRKPRTLKQMSESMDVIKGLACGEEVLYNGEKLKFSWVNGGDLDIWVAGYGPKALKLCGEKADGFVLQLADLDIAKWTIETVRKAAADAGRNPDDLYICVVAPAYVGDDLPHQRDQLRWFGGMVGNHVADLVERYGKDGSVVPQDLTDYIEKRKDYDYAEHGRSGNEHTSFVPDEIVDRFCLLGPVEKHLEKLNALKDLGVDQFAIYLMHDQQDQTMFAYGQQIIPAMRS